MTDGNAPLSLADQFAAAQDWWRDAGVDGFFSDTPAPWLHEEGQDAEAPPAAAAPVQAQPAAPVRPAIGGAPEIWPGDLCAFHQWWLSEPALDPCGGAGPRILPRGPADAGLMILVAQPEAEDTARLLSGPLGGLLSRFLAAAGIAEDECYLAAALPRHAAFAEALADTGLAALTRHHVSLANPGRLLVFGQNILPLIGHDPAQSGASLEIVNHQGRSIPVFASRSLELMLQRPAMRSRFWQRWLDWTG